MHIFSFIAIFADSIESIDSSGNAGGYKTTNTSHKLIEIQIVDSGERVWITIDVPRKLNATIDQFRYVRYPRI